MKNIETLDMSGDIGLKVRGNIYEFHPDPQFFLTGKSPEPAESEEAKETALL